MMEPPQTNPPESPASRTERAGEDSRRLRGLALAIGLLLICFSRQLFALLLFAVRSELYSYIVLIPCVSLYLIWGKRSALRSGTAPARGLATILAAAGLAMLAVHWSATAAGADLAPEDSLALTSLSFVLLLLGACAWFLGRRAFRIIAFPLGFLGFIVPIPTRLADWIVIWLQHGSAAASFGMFKLSGTAVFYHDLIFQLPGFSLEIAPECSGIHSSLVLFITSVLAGHLFLRTPWKRFVLAVAVIPLALLRNGLRVFTIGELCVHIGPQMIDSFIHRRGGPVFFALSLLPFFLLLFFLARSDRANSPGKSATAKA